jgi:hypothetical protein
MTKALKQHLSVQLDDDYLVEAGRLLKKLKTEHSSSENMSETFHLDFYLKR